MTHEDAMRQGAVKILHDYDHPPEGGTLVPRGWVEENRAELEVWAVVERQMLGDLSNWKPEGLGPLIDAMTRPAPGYTEIANEGGIHWHQRIEAERDTLAQAKASACYRADTCVFDDACPFIITCGEHAPDGC